MNTESRTPLQFNELLELFKHLDTRVSHQELLYVPLSAAFVPATLASWDKAHANPLILLAVAVGSLLIYLYHIISIRRFAVFQCKIFNKINKNHRSDFYDIMHNPMGRIGVQSLRVIGFPLLGAVWSLLMFQVDFLGYCQGLKIFAGGSLFVVPVVVCLFLLRDTEKRT